jgi:uncharacterized protein YggE
MRRVLAFVLVLVASPVLAQPAPSHQSPLPPAFTLSGEGIASAKPDIAVLVSGVVTQAKTAREALDANTTAMTKLLDSFKSADIEERDLATSGFSVQPRYVYTQRNDGTQEAPRITGYEVRNTVTVKVRDLAKLGSVLDTAVTQGSNQIDGLSFDISDKAALLDEARKKAYADARHKAETYAAAAGVKLGRLRDLSEQGGGFPPPRPMMMRAEAAKSADVPIAQGEQEIQVNVTVTWELE